MSAPEPLDLLARLEHGYAPKLAPVYADMRDEVLAYAAERAQASPARRHAEVLAYFCERQADEIAALAQAEAAFQTRFASALDEAEQRAAILAFADQLGQTKQQLRGDAKAFDRFFDADAVLERFAKRGGERERALAYGLDRLGVAIGAAMAESADIRGASFFSETFLPLIARMRQWPGDPRVRTAAHACVRQMAERMIEEPEDAWFDMLISATRRVCLDESEAVWTQCEAIDALLALSPESLPSVIDRRLSGDLESKPEVLRDRALFVQRHLVRLLCHNFHRSPKFARYLPILANSREGAVRQAFADSLHHLPPEAAKGMLTRLRVDRDPQVRAAIFADPARIIAHVGAAAMAAHICRIFTHEEQEFTLRIALDAAAGTLRHLRETGSSELDGTNETLKAGFAQLQQRTQSAKVLRWLDEARERSWLYATAEAIEIADILAEIVNGQLEGTVRRARALKPYLDDDPELVGRVMAVLAQRDFGLSLQASAFPSVQRGEFFRRRLWRILFEGGNSATDKRQAFRHAIGRHYHGTMWAPSARMAELAPTKVPGEPLFESSEGGWRNYLPLLDQVLTVLDRGGTCEIYTSAGITAITAPDSIVRRMRAFWRISRDFPRLASLRNREPDDYLAALRKFEIDIAFRPYRDSPGEPNPKVVKLFSVGGVFAALPVLWDRALAYFSTVYENNLLELAIFVALASLWFFGRHMALGWHARRLRARLPLSLGGWGTRGKSGTERLKAGLINALGPSIVSKTTGCEAMFLLGTPFGDLTEMFLFRPYDKATIWEQYQLLQTSDGLKGRVFLWECMGLNPAYVKVLQQDWMRDDIGTITNTYPDHEDVQGPAGRNIPEVMCQFIPHDSFLLTTEEEMLPILAEGAAKAGTRMQAVTWKEAGLIHQSLLDRFPYEEHPYNIALVTAMGAELGLEPDFCIKEMSDRVVADLGVLKTYPRSTINGRTLEFVMGMSANERFGAMGNWTRMGFIDHSLERDPEIFVSTIVNNRADRVPRSRVFARMLVHDVSADKHVLIGSNIEGLLGFIEEEWDAYAAEVTLVDEDAEPAALLEELAKKQRIPVTAEELAGRLTAMVAGVDDAADVTAALGAAKAGTLADHLQQAGIKGADAIAAHYAALAELHAEYTTLADQARSGSASDQAVRALLAKAFHAKLVPVYDYYMKGEYIVRLVAESTPPGLINRIMGMQNIKGTGLDWVYRWQAWEAVWKACEQMRDEDPGTVERGYRFLASFQEFGILSEKAVRAAIAGLRSRIEQVPTVSPLQLDALETRLDDQMKQFDSSASEADADKPKEGGWLSGLGSAMLEFAEAFIDAGDAVRRRKAADRIYKALIAEQISSQRAATELKKLTSRQKGGWLAKDLQEIPTKLSEKLRRD
ncbi:hypothetical protein [Parerythrobacter aestuarii]|uniref:hypothetical protein n=1 Tax=Parerythrobacter aestuarii TaxID=3020909 RepID=UPI0024DE249D|nr:hypothetical protein [Parerythrobacter aestuarii]